MEHSESSKKIHCLLGMVLATASPPTSRSHPFLPYSPSKPVLIENGHLFCRNLVDKETVNGVCSHPAGHIVPNPEKRSVLARFWVPERHTYTNIRRHRYVCKYRYVCIHLHICTNTYTCIYAFACPFPFLKPARIGRFGQVQIVARETGCLRNRGHMLNSHRFFCCPGFACARSTWNLHRQLLQRVSMLSREQSSLAEVVSQAESKNSCPLSQLPNVSETISTFDPLVSRTFQSLKSACFRKAVPAPSKNVVRLQGGICLGFLHIEMHQFTLAQR